MDYILSSFPITDDEYKNLEKQFGRLVHYEALQLVQKNVKNNYTDDLDDIRQELRWSLICAGSYFKRQVYLESCMKTAKFYIKDEVVMKILENLEQLWKDRTKHGANKQKFGKHQEDILEDIVQNHVPESERPNKKAPLQINKKFGTYCKAISWNRQKSLGKKITREKAIRSGIVSLSEYDYLASSGDLSLVSNKN